MLIWCCGVLSVLVLGVAGLGTYVYQHLSGNIGSTDLDQRLGGDRPDNLSPGSKNILVVGSDSRDGTGSKYGKGLDTMQSDTLMVVHLAADRKWATVVSFPRDSYVPVPACDRGDGTTSAPTTFKINSAFATGGSTGDIGSAAACTIKTVEQNTGLRIDHFASVDFQGFKGMVNALGGIEVCPEEAIHDKKAQLDMEAGCQTVKDEQALGYVRTRYAVGDGSDLGRIGRQQEFMQALADKAQHKLTSPDALYGFLDSTTKSLTTDSALAGLKPLYDLASELRDVPGDRLTFLTVPNYPRQEDVPADKANVVWQYPQAADLFKRLRHDREVDKKKLEEDSARVVTAHSVRVQVLNGTATPGQAAKAAQRLRSLGFTVTGTGNSPRPTDTTTVTAPEDLAEEAEVLAGRLDGLKQGGIDPETSPEATPGLVTLTVGSDFEEEAEPGAGQEPDGAAPQG
ncbi:LCP family protein [Streptomyces sp. HNM0574]|uniref:LCP family protein n=1 Tax=Streptomyces sp. HNM0574 TaxID=2714954 RepID=UPI003217C36C